MAKLIASLRSKRAINPIIATLLLTVIVVVLAVTAWGFYSGYFATLMGGAAEVPYIENVDFPTATSVTVYVRNKGDTAFVVDTLYIDGTSVSITETTVNAGDVQAITGSFSWSSGTSYTFKVVTQKGSETTRTETAP